MVGIGYCEFEGCRKRTNKRFCRDHKTFIQRDEARERMDSGSVFDAIVERLRFYL